MREPELYRIVASKSTYYTHPPPHTHPSHIHTPPPPSPPHTHLVQSEHYRLIVFLTALHHASERVREPLLEVCVRREDGGHEEVHERPQLHQVVLQRCARQEEAALTVEVEESLPALALEVLDVLGLSVSQLGKKGGVEGGRYMYLQCTCT